MLAEVNEQAIEQQGMSGFTAISGLTCWASNMVGLFLQALGTDGITAARQPLGDLTNRQVASSPERRTSRSAKPAQGAAGLGCSRS